METIQQNFDQLLEQDQEQTESSQVSEIQQPGKQKSKLCWIAESLIEFTVEVSVGLIGEFFSHH